VPVLIGGSTSFAARRAGRLGDGFFPYVISPEDLAERAEEMRVVAREQGRDAAALEISVMPGSYAPGAALDLDLAQRYVDAGVSRIVVNAQECGSMQLEDIRRFVAELQERVIAKL
jgi:alkanesulfonate monooxygenase SsuD/methylene tetrahydromethanopterin reductase-like flavin-dependent oxidoreductase (luciferase family)